MVAPGMMKTPLPVATMMIPISVLIQCVAAAVVEKKVGARLQTHALRAQTSNPCSPVCVSSARPTMLVQLQISIICVRMLRAFLRLQAVPPWRRLWFQMADAAWKTLQKWIGVSATISPSLYESKGCQWPLHGMLTFVRQFVCLQPITQGITRCI